jgi:hypothetical protein
LEEVRLFGRTSRAREDTIDPYWEAFIHRPPADPNNLITHAFQGLQEGGTNPVRTEVHSRNVMASHIKELGQFYGAEIVGIVALESESESEPGAAIVSVLKADYDTRTARGIGGQTPALKGLFETFTLAAYIRELGYRATRASPEDEERGERMAAAAGLGTLDAEGRLVTPRLGRNVYVAELIYTDLPLEADGTCPM